MPSPPKVMVIALDAGEPTLLRKWAGEGLLPNLARLLETGRSSNVDSCAAEFPDEIWPSTYSSVNAAKLGKYYYIQLKLGSEELELVEDRPKAEQFWHSASKHGRRVCVIDPPKTAVSDPVNGYQLCAWGTHATHCELATHPPELLDDILAKHGAYPIETSDNHDRSARSYRKLRDHLIEGAHKHGALFRDLLSRDSWDLFFCGFSETHAGGHQFWHVQDPAHPQHDPDNRDGLNTALLEIFQAVDDEVGKLADLAGPDTHLIVFSGHGMQAQYHGRDFVPKLLELWGLTGDRNIEPDPTNEQRIVLRRDLVQRLKALVPMQIQYAVKHLLPRWIEDAIVCRVMGSPKLDPNARVNYVPNNDLNPAFRLNLKGRDPHGKIDPGAEYEAVLAFLEQRLSELVIPSTGEPAIVKITRLHDIYHGPNLDVLPDLSALWSADAWIEEVRSPGYGSVSGGHHDLRTGGHAVDGFFLYRGPNRAIDFETMPSNKDLAPTVLDLIDVPIPAFMEGRSLASASVAVESASAAESA